MIVPMTEHLKSEGLNKTTSTQEDLGQTLTKNSILHVIRGCTSQVVLFHITKRP